MTINPEEDTRGKWSDTTSTFKLDDELRYSSSVSFCFMDEGTAVGGGGEDEGEREMEVEYPVEDGAGELLLELVPDGCEDAEPLSGDLFRL